MLENSRLAGRVAELEEERSVWKDARAKAIEEAEHEKQQLRWENADLMKRINYLESISRQVGFPLPIRASQATKAILQEITDRAMFCLIDGNTCAFEDRFFSQGKEGGREAIRTLNNGISDYIHNQGIVSQSQRVSLWVSIYFDKTALLATLRARGACTADEYEAFILGVQDASPRLQVIDTGKRPGAADSKIEGLKGDAQM